MNNTQQLIKENKNLNDTLNILRELIIDVEADIYSNESALYNTCKHSWLIEYSSDEHTSDECSICGCYNNYNLYNKN
jgi:hypothetical protein